MYVRADGIEKEHDSFYSFSYDQTDIHIISWYIQHAKCSLKCKIQIYCPVANKEFELFKLLQHVNSFSP